MTALVSSELPITPLLVVHLSPQAWNISMMTTTLFYNGNGCKETSTHKYMTESLGFVDLALVT